MLRVLIRLLLLAVPFVGFLVWFEIARGGRDTNLYVVKRRLLEAAAPRVEVLAMGPSHAWEGIAPLLVHPGAFNLAGASQSLYYDCALVRHYTPELPHLRLVVLPVSYFTPEYELDRSPESWRAYYYRRFHGIRNRDWRLETHLRNWSTWFLYGSGSGLATVRGTQPPDIRAEYDAAGGRVDLRPPADRPLHPTPDHVRSSASSTTSRHNSMMNPASLADNRSRLMSLLGFLRDRGIGAVFVTLPVSSGYRAGQRPEVMARTAAMMGDLKREFGVEWRDYSADPRFSEDDFWDADHLNFSGAAKFSTMLGAEVVVPALAKLPVR